MNNLEFFYSAPSWAVWLTMVVLVWDMVWKVLAFWRSARNNDLGWFVCIAIFNTVGILPIIYLLTHPKKEQSNTK